MTPLPYIKLLRHPFRISTKSTLLSVHRLGGILHYLKLFSFNADREIQEICHCLITK